MCDQQVAQARSYAYRLFSRLFLNGLTADLYPYVQAVPELKAALPGAGSDIVGANPVSSAPSDAGPTAPLHADQEAAAHYYLLGYNVFPFQSIFLDPQSLLGGPVTDSVLAFYRRVGFGVTFSAESADHAGVELALLAFLCGAEADAWRDGLVQEALRMQHWQRRFLDEHLLRWLLPLVFAIHQQQQPFYSALAELTLELALDHRSALGGSAEQDVVGFLPPVPDLLNNEQAGLREIVDYLLTPVFSGLFLSRDDVTRLARRQRLPRGFGTRGQMLTNLLRTAADYESLDRVLTDLQALLEHWRASYAAYLDLAPPVSTIASHWLERLAVTQGLLERLSLAAQHSQSAVHQERG